MHPKGYETAVATAFQQTHVAHHKQFQQLSCLALDMNTGLQQDQILMQNRMDGKSKRRTRL
jgi:hypothetical protein